MALHDNVLGVELAGAPPRMDVMGSVWLTIPSKRPPEEAEPVLKLWRARGYKIALWRDWPSSEIDGVDYAAIIEEYPGYAMATNSLIRAILKLDTDADWFVCGGDDVEPDLNHSAEEIARQCSEHFKELHYEEWKSCAGRFVGIGNTTATFGVMQPTGDRFAGGSIDRICGSAWIGREFARRINQGRGPLWPEYLHMFVDEELQEVALKMGVLWQRPDLIQLHHHFMRESNDLHSEAIAKPIPEHLKQWNTPEHWRKYQTLFKERKAAGFPGSECID